MNKKKDKKLEGSVLVYMLFLLVTMSAIGLGIMFSAVSNLKNSIVSTNTDNAMSATENGVEMFFFRAKNGFVNNYQPTVVLENILGDCENNVCCKDGVVKVNVGGKDTAWNERLRFKLEFFKEGDELVSECTEPVINIRHVKSTGYYNNTVRAISMPVSFDFYEKGLIGNWKLDDDEDSSEAANSADGEVPNGELSGAVKFVSETIPNNPKYPSLTRNVLEFNSGGYVKIGNFDNKPKAITLSAWVKKSDTGAVNRFVDVISVENDVRMRIRPGEPSDKYGAIGWYNDDDSNSGVGTSDEAIFDDGKWHHVVYTVNPDESRQRIYLDGELLKKNTSSLAPIKYTDNGNIYLGTDKATTQIFIGKMRNVRIYDRELLIPEVKMLHSATWNQ